jgi:hypothetical protein
MQDSTWLDIEAQNITTQLAQRRGSETPIIPIITEISIPPSTHLNRNCAAIRNIDIFNLQDELIDRLRAQISRSRIALDQWVGFDRAHDGDADSSVMRLYMRSLLTAPELPHLDRTARDLTHQAGRRLSIGHGSGAVIDFRFHRPGRGQKPPNAQWKELAPLIQILDRPCPGMQRQAGPRIRPNWMVNDKESALRGMKVATFSPVEVHSFLMGIECGFVTSPQNAVLGLALVNDSAKPGTPIMAGDKTRHSSITKSPCDAPGSP